MNKIFRSMVLAFVLGGALVLAGCSEDAAPPSDTLTYSLNGGTTMTASDGLANSCVFAAYSPGVDHTNIIAVGNVDQAAGTFDFLILGAPGQATGTFSEIDGAGGLFTIGGVFDLTFGTPASLTFSAYGAAGGLIVGTYNMTGVGGENVTGDFSVTREVDDFDTSTAVCS